MCGQEQALDMVASERPYHCSVTIMVLFDGALYPYSCRIAYADCVSFTWNVCPDEDFRSLERHWKSFVVSLCSLTTMLLSPVHQSGSFGHNPLEQSNKPAPFVHQQWRHCFWKEERSVSIQKIFRPRNPFNYSPPSHILLPYWCPDNSRRYYCAPIRRLLENTECACSCQRKAFSFPRNI